ncbi:MAG TPA: hypothetical protein VNN07_12710 [Candidatus Tectomicrobia bacterium]|nr:hypothetical protein [Candidatus Tectomicrobia bacterium]
MRWDKGRRSALLVALALVVVGFTAVPRIVAMFEGRSRPAAGEPAPVAGESTPAAGEPAPAAADLYAAHFRDTRHERMFLASIAFFVTFAVVRTITHLIRAGRGPFHDLVTQGGHVHHLVWGIVLLLGVGYLWLLEVGAGDSARPWASRLTALLFGVGSALTLDEFALWLTLRDVYWEREGRLSIDAVLLFGGLLSIALWGGPFLVDIVALWSRVS